MANKAGFLFTKYFKERLPNWLWNGVKDIISFGFSDGIWIIHFIHAMVLLNILAAFILKEKIGNAHLHFIFLMVPFFTALIWCDF